MKADEFWAIGPRYNVCHKNIVFALSIKISFLLHLFFSLPSYIFAIETIINFYLLNEGQGSLWKENVHTHTHPRMHTHTY